MTDPYIQINGDKIEVFDNDLSAVKSIKQLDEDFKVNTKCRAWLNGAQNNLTDATPTKVLLDTESYDIGGNFAAYKFVAPVAGYYLIVGSIQFAGVIADKRYQTCIYKNNALLTGAVITNGTGTGDLVIPVIDTVYLAATNYIELFAYVVCGANTVDIGPGITNTFLSIHLLSL